MTEINVPWSVVRRGIHLPYDYIEGEPQQFDFLYNISDDDLALLERHCLVQRHYDLDPTEGELDWSDVYKFVLVEREYRQGQEY